MSSCIYVVATPIGHLDDFSPRARHVLEEADVIAAEDTRHSRQLLSHFGIHGKELVSYYDEVEQKRSVQLIDRLSASELTLALISDAGTPCISDPGYRLIKLAHEAGIPVHPIPGASSLSSLVSVSGLPTDRLLFVGFLPSKEKACTDEIVSWVAGARSIVFYVAMRRLEKVLRWIQGVYPDAIVCIGRELTKVHEEVFTLPISQTIERIAAKSILKGEATVMVYLSETAKQLDRTSLEEMISKDLQNGATFKDLWKAYSAFGIARSDLYQMMLAIKQKEKV